MTCSRVMSSCTANAGSDLKKSPMRVSASLACGSTAGVSAAGDGAAPVSARPEPALTTSIGRMSIDARRMLGFLMDNSLGRWLMAHALDVPGRLRR